MKNLRISLLLAIMTLVFYAANAQQSEKELKKDISEKATREARREAKEFEKKGYSVASLRASRVAFSLISFFSSFSDC